MVAYVHERVANGQGSTMLDKIIFLLLEKTKGSRFHREDIPEHPRTEELR